MSRFGDSPALRQFKRRAKALKKERGLSHSEALEVLAEIEGYLDYAEAQRLLQHDALLAELAKDEIP